MGRESAVSELWRE